MKSTTVLTESLEDYLEVILELEKTNKVARVKDIAEKLNIQRGSVTGAVKLLHKKELINYQPYSFITLTKKGRTIAKKITYRHHILKDFLLRVVQLEPENAEATACKMEHTIDDNSFEKFIQFIQFIDNCPRTGEDWINSFVTYCSLKQNEHKRCSECIDKCKIQFTTIKNDTA